MHVTSSYRLQLMQVLRHHFLSILTPLSLEVTESSLSFPYMICLQFLVNSFSSEYRLELQNLFENEIHQLLLVPSSLGPIETLWNWNLFRTIRCLIPLASSILHLLHSKHISSLIQERFFLIQRRLHLWLFDIPNDQWTQLSTSLYDWLGQQQVTIFLSGMKESSTQDFNLTTIQYHFIRSLLPSPLSHQIHSSIFTTWFSSSLEFIENPQYRHLFLGLLESYLEKDIDWELLDLQRHLLTNRIAAASSSSSSSSVVVDLKRLIDRILLRQYQLRPLIEIQPNPLTTVIRSLSPKEEKELVSLLKSYKETHEIPSSIYQDKISRPIWFSQLFLPRLLSLSETSELYQALSDVNLPLVSSSCTSLDDESSIFETLTLFFNTFGFKSSSNDLSWNNFKYPPLPSVEISSTSYHTNLKYQTLMSFDILVNIFTQACSNDKIMVTDTIQHSFSSYSSSSSSLSRSERLNVFQTCQKAFSSLFLTLISYPLCWKQVLLNVLRRLSLSLPLLSNDPWLQRVALISILGPLSSVTHLQPLLVDIFLRGLFSSKASHSHAHMLGHWSAYLSSSSLDLLRNSVETCVYSSSIWNPPISSSVSPSSSSSHHHPLLLLQLDTFLQSLIKSLAERNLLFFDSSSPSSCDIPN